MTRRHETLKLYELPEAFRVLEDAIDEAGGELTADLEARLDALEGNLRDKVDAVAALVGEAGLNADLIKIEIDRLQKRRQSELRKAESLKGYVGDMLTRMGRDRVKGARFTASVCRNSAASIAWVGEGEPPDEFTVTERRFAASKVRAAIDAGQTVPEGVRIERGTHVRIS